MEKLSTNILILGKTGVGKSSFINYIYGDVVREKGAGKPVTGKGLYEVRIEDEKLIYNIYDSWGLEADKASSWSEDILMEVKKKNRHLSIKEWFHTIYYCFSAATARIEHFEIEQIIRPLIEEGNKVSIILTHCDIAMVEQKIQGMKKLLKEKLNLTEADIICVASEGKKLLGGKRKEPFGREEVLGKIRSNLWQDIEKKLPHNYHRYILQELSKWRTKSKENVGENIRLIKRTKDAHRTADEISKDLQDVFKRVNEKAQLYEVEARNYYIQLIGHLYGFEMELIKLEDNQRESHIVFEPEDKFAEVATAIVFACIPLVNLMVPYLLVESTKDKLRGSIDEKYEEIKRLIPAEVKEYRERIAATYRSDMALIEQYIGKS